MRIDEFHLFLMALSVRPGSRCTHQAPRVSGSGRKQRNIEIAGARESGSPGLRARECMGRPEVRADRPCRDLGCRDLGCGPIDVG